MSFKEVKELRKSGQLEEALKMAQEDLETNPENIWNKRSISWVYYDYLKKYADLADYENFKSILQKVKELELPEEEKMLFDNSVWQVGKMIYSLSRNKNNIEEHKIREIFETIKDFPFSKPSEGYSFLFKAFHKGYNSLQDPRLYLKFADWWGFDNFRKEDYLKEEYNGRKIMSIAEKAYIAYPKKLLLQNPLPVDTIREFIPKLDVVGRKYPDFQYPFYHKTKLSLALGEKDVLETFLPFAKEKKNDYWVWELLAEIFRDDFEKQMACYCKALTLRTQESFLVNLRPKFAEILAEKKMYDEAKTELNKTINLRNEKKWKIPNDIKRIMHLDWFKSAQAKKHNKDLYHKYAPIAEEILFSDITEELIVVDYVNKDKKILNFVKNKEKSGFLNYSNLLNNPKKGDIVQARLEAVGDDGFFRALSLKNSNETETEACKNFEGVFQSVNGKTFGFVDDIFVEPRLVQSAQLENGENITGSAVLSYDKTKKKWGWKVLKINKL